MRLSALTSTRTPATPLLDDLRANAVSYRHFRHAAEAGHAHAWARYLSSLPEMPGSVRLDASAPLAAACPACLEQIPLSADDKRYYVHGSRTAKREGEPSGAFSQRASHSKEDSPAGAEKAAKSSRDYSGTAVSKCGVVDAVVAVPLGELSQRRHSDYRRRRQAVAHMNIRGLGKNNAAALSPLL